MRRASSWAAAFVALALATVLVLAAFWLFSDGWDRCVARGDDSGRVISCSERGPEGLGEHVDARDPLG